MDSRSKTLSPPVSLHAFKDLRGVDVSRACRPPAGNANAMPSPRKPVSPAFSAFCREREAMRQALDSRRSREPSTRPATAHGVSQAPSSAMTMGRPPVDQVDPVSHGAKRKDSAQQSSAASSMVELGVITLCDEDDAECVQPGSECVESTDSKSAEEALLQVLTTTLRLLRSGEQAVLFRSCAEFVRMAEN